MRNLFTTICLAIVLLIVMSVNPVHAIPTVTINDLINPAVTVVDNGAGDLDFLTEGQIMYSGTIGVFTINMVMAATKPAAGSAENPMMDLSSFSLTSSGAGSIQIMFSEDNFGPLNSGIDGFLTSVSLASDDSSTQASFQAYVDTSNALNGLDHTIAGIGLTGNGLDSESHSLHGLDFPFSLTSVLGVTHTGAATTSLTSKVVATGTATTAVAEPGTLLLLGSGLLGVGVLSRKRHGHLIRS